jgi:diguanylate cyclase (GGDEF)-like protein/PAS domain S-box-containing protein
LWVVILLFVALIALFYWQLALVERKFKLSEQQSEEVFEDVDLLVVRLDREGRIIFCNRFLLELTGWTWPQVVGRNWFDVFIPPQEGARERFAKAMAQTEVVSQYKNSILTRQGELRQVLWNSSLLRDEHGRVVGTTSIGQDITAYDRAEEDRLHSEKILRQIAETVQDVVLLTDATAIIQYVTPSIYAVAGLKPEDLIGRSAYRVLDPEQGRIFEQMVLTATPADHFVQAGFSYNHPDGRQRVLEASINFLFTPDAVYQGAVVGLRDVTARHQAEQAVRQSEQRLRELTNSMRDVVLLLDLRGEIEYVTPSVKEALGFDPDELLGRRALDFFDPEDHPWVLEAVRAAREGRRPLRLEYQHRHKDGFGVWLETYLDFIYDPGGNPLRLVLGARPIQDRRNAEEQLRKSEKLLRQVTDAIQDIVLMTDENAIIRYITPSVHKVIGLSPELIVGRSAYSILDAEQSRRFQDRAKAATPDKPFAEASFTFVRPDGVELFMEASIHFLFDSQGHDRGAVTGLRDVTARHRAEQAVRERERMLRQITDAMQDVVAFTDSDRLLRYVTPSVEPLFGYRPEQLIGRSVLDYLAPEDRARVLGLTQQSQAGNESLRLEARFRHVEGHYLWMDTIFSGIFDGAGKPIGSVMSGRDVTERRKTEEALREREFRLSQITNSIQDVVLLLDPQSTIQYVTPSVRQMLGFGPDELLGQHVSVLVSPEDMFELQQEGSRALAERRAYQLEYECLHKDGHRVWIEGVVNFVWDEGGGLQGIVVGMRNIGERKRQQAHVEFMAYHDELTKLPNRRALRRVAEEALVEAARLETPVSLLYLDLDNFKIVNDSLGHDVGDELLVEASQILSKQLPADDMLARLGGDEFACVLVNASVEKAQQVAFRMSKAIRSALGSSDRAPHLSGLGVSVGVASFPKDGHTFVELLRAADIAMYQAKESGSRVVVYDASKSPYTDERMQFEADLRQAVKEHRLELLFQPIWHLKTQRVEGAEALLCWPYKDRVLSASEFVPLAEEIHLVEQMDRIALQQGLIQLKQWQQQKQPYRLSINISTQSLAQPDAVQELLRLLGGAAIDPSWLTLEVTESVLLRNPDEARKVLNQFRALGVRVAIDDFGSGYASLSYLRQLPLDRLKIDRSFIGYLGSSVRDEKLVRAAIDLAHSLEAEVVAEGVETPLQLTWLRENGCDLAQGYLVSLPVPISSWPSHSGKEGLEQLLAPPVE